VFAGRLPGTPREGEAFFFERGAPRLDTKETTMTKFLALIAATLLAFAAQAGDKDKSHAALDTNGDGYLSKAEFMAKSKT
jgi:hypothetical protein